MIHGRLWLLIGWGHTIIVAPLNISTLYTLSWEACDGLWLQCKVNNAMKHSSGDERSEFYSAKTIYSCCSSATLASSVLASSLPSGCSLLAPTCAGATGQSALHLDRVKPVSRACSRRWIYPQRGQAGIWSTLRGRTRPSKWCGQLGRAISEVIF